MTDSPKKRPGMNFSISEMIAWVAGLSAFAGLIGEFLRQFQTDDGSILAIGCLIVYVIYLSIAVPLFWNTSRLVTPITLFISSALWTLSIQFTAIASIGWSIASMVAVPPFTAFLMTRLLPQVAEGDSSINRGESGSPVQTLLARGKGFGKPPSEKPVGSSPH